VSVLFRGGIGVPTCPLPSGPAGRGIAGISIALGHGAGKSGVREEKGVSEKRDLERSEKCDPQRAKKRDLENVHCKSPWTKGFVNAVATEETCWRAYLFPVLCKFFAAIAVSPW
jgi:hypothetical protein